MSQREAFFPWQQYLHWMLGACIAVVTIAGAVNVAFDPLGVFGTPRIDGFNAVKPYVDHHRDLARYAGGRRSCADTGIFGNSRAEIGFDPQSPAFAERGLLAFNHAIPGSNAVTAYRQIQWLKAAGCTPRTIILGVEFFDFLGGTKPKPMPTLQSDPPPSVDARFLAEAVFSISGLRDAATTFLAQRADFPATITDRGFNPLRNYVPEVERHGHYVLFRQRAEENVRNWRRKPIRLRAPGEVSSDDEEALDAILADAVASGSGVHLVIYPYHAQIRMLVERLGLGDVFTDWKRLIHGIAKRHAVLGGSVKVWDFSGVGTETLEVIPMPGDRITHLTHYWEAGHFKQGLGERVLQRILGQSGDFGVLLGTENIDAWLTEDRARVSKLLAQPSPLVSEVESVLSRNSTGR